MADVVQYRLERMVNELDDLEKKGLFTRREIAEIVKKRRKFEYRLKRPSPLKQDFLAYIEYEKQLDALRFLRRKAVSKKLKEQGNKRLKKSVSDFAGITRIIELYRLATNRFKGDIELWFQYLEYCRQKRNGRMKKALASVIRFHPKVPGVWIYAAAWEFDHNLNVAAARALMQNGLRVCPTSEDLWVEYLRMELTYLNKLKARKIALGENVKPLVRDKGDANDKQWKDENKDLFMSLSSETENNHDFLQDGESEEKLDVLQEQGLIILHTIYEGSVEALPTSLSLRKRFYDIVESTDLANSEDMKKEILVDMRRDFSTEPEYWDWLARCEVPSPEDIQKGGQDFVIHQQKAIQVYEEATENVPSATIFKLFTKFIKDIIGSEIADAQSSGPIDTPYLLEVYKKAEKMGCLDEELAQQHISLYLQLGKYHEAQQLAINLCDGKFSNSAQIWYLRLSIEMRHIASSTSPRDDLRAVFEPLRKILTKLTVSEAENLWLMALKFFGSHREYFNKLVQISQMCLVKGVDGDEGFSLSSAIVKLVIQKDSVDRAREMYKQFLALPHPGISLYKTCIELEENLAAIGVKDSLKNARRLYETALASYDHDVSLWRDYYAMEIKMGTSETANAVYWRARKTLKDATALVAAHDV
ncbi:U3 small nucleolar RNA-associated protein 6 [Dillenia turbinata]|uniref:U3 small nucleolar RNA-associated protein 6 n=1 Tax=Dillenia turbinata TaxID=194707 RepID=A0AAN8ULI3_9MAGN